MRIDKFLKVSRLVKRRTLAQELLDNNRVYINDKIAKKSTNIQKDDIIVLRYGNRDLKVKVIEIREVVSKDEASTMYEVL